MKFTIYAPQQIEVKTLEMTLPVMYEEEDIPNDFPGRNDETVKMVIDLDTGVIQGWPAGRTEEVFMKVRDGGTYILLDPIGNRLAVREQDYVPNGLVPGEYGDYVELEIDATGRITNWPTKPSLNDFYPQQ